MAETSSSVTVTSGRAISSRAAMQPLERRSSRLLKQDEIEDVDEDAGQGKESGGGGDGSLTRVRVSTAADSSKKMAHTSTGTEVAVCVVNGDGDIGHGQDVTVAVTTDCRLTTVTTTSSQDTANLDNVDVPDDSRCSTLVSESECSRATERALFLSSSGHVVIVSQDSVDSDNSNLTLPGGRQKSLVRCSAVCDDNCSQGDADSGTASGDGAPSHVIRSFSLLTPGGSSSLGSSTDRDVSPELSRDVSLDRQYTDNKGVDLEAFFKATLNKSHSDRMMLLKLEQEMLAFIRDDSASEKKLGPMQKSYDRMLVHRVAAFFGLEHNVDSTGKVVVVTKGPNVRVPEFKFTENFGECAPSEDDQPKKLLRRDPECRSFDETRSRLTLDGKKSRSFEERSMAYEQARARLFNQPDESQSSKTYYTSHLNPHNSGHGKSSTSQWVGSGGRRQWSSTESGYSTDGGRRGNVSKAGSLSGVTLLSRNDSHGSGSVLCKTDSTCSGTVSSVCSPMRPPPIPCSPPPDCHLSESGSSRSGASPAQFAAQGPESNSIPILPFSVDEGGGSIAVWVASGLDVIPDGSIIINPDTGKPHLNADGSIFRWKSAQVCRSDVNTANTEQPSISPPTNMATNVKPVDSPQYTAFTGQQAYDASEQSTCMAISADEQQPMVMMAPQMQPIPGVQVASGYAPVQQQQAMGAGTAAPYSSYPLFNFSNMTIQSVEMYPAYASQQPQQMHVQQTYAAAAPQSAAMPEGVVQQQQPYVHYHHHGGAAAYTPYPYVAAQPTAVMGGGGNMYVAAPPAAYLVPTALQLPAAPIQQQNGVSPASANARQVAYVGQAVMEGGRPQQPGVVVSMRNPSSLAHVVVGQPMAPSPASTSASGVGNMYANVSQQQPSHVMSAGPPSRYHGVAVQQQQASQTDVYANNHQQHYQYVQQQMPAQRPMTLVAPVRQQTWTEGGAGNCGTTRVSRDSTPPSNTNIAALRLVSPPTTTQQQASVPPRRRSTRTLDKTGSSQE